MEYKQSVRPANMEQITIYRNDKEFCSWPFNAGMWKINENNIVVGFMNIPCDYSIPSNLHHGRIETYSKIKSVRTRDRGLTWSEPTEIADNIQTTHDLKFGKPFTYTEGFDFNDPNVLLECWSSPNSGDENAFAWVKMSTDGGETWGEPVILPKCGIPRYQGRPSYIVRPDGVVLLFLTAQPRNNSHDRPVVFASFDQGVSWALISFMPNSNEYRMICPSPVMLKDGTILVAIRCKPDMIAAWDELYASDDGGLTWRFVSRINEHGDTVHLTLMEDGRLFAVYGYRRAGYGVRARISEDNGATWGAELILRDDGGSLDLGYPRAIEVRPGELLASYYYNDKSDPIGVRYIGGTILKV